jgi:hypothetical protein
VPTAVWGAFVELAGQICPLTPLEQSLRVSAGESGYDGDFIEQYLLPVLYPGGLTREGQIVLGLALLVTNAAIYGAVWRRRPNRNAREKA